MLKRLFNLIRDVSPMALIVACLGIGLAFAQTTGIILTSPVVVPGSFNYNGGPQTSGIYASGGTFTCSGSAATITNSKVTANSIILMTLKTVGGTVVQPFIVTITPGTGATVTCGGSDTSVYNYFVLG